MMETGSYAFGFSLLLSENQTTGLDHIQIVKQTKALHGKDVKTTIGII